MVSKIKNMKRILIIILCFTNLIAFSQSILVNNTSVNVSSDISFPYWLDSTSTLAIDSNVVSISVLEFNITPTTNGNSLVFNQAKSVTSQETVPSGKTWKVESVLLDPSFVSTSNNNSGTTVVSGGGGSLRPVALSNESASTMTLGDAALYCDSLVEDGYDNWVVPNEQELHFTSSGGVDVPGIRSSNYLWTYNRKEDNANDVLCFRINTFDASWNNYPGDYMHVRCVRHAAVTVSSGGGSSSGGSGNVVSSGLTPIAISTESANSMLFNQAMSYCDTLLEDGYDNWLLPTIDELTYVGSGGLELPDSKTVNKLWSRSPVKAGASSYDKVYILGFLQDSAYSLYENALRTAHTAGLLGWGTFKTRCIRRGAVTVSSSQGGSSSGGSTPSTLGAGMPTMISNQSDSVMSIINAALYCANLQESGYDDWILPNFDQLSYAISGGCVFNDQRTPYYLWSRTQNGSNLASVMASDVYTGSFGGYWGFESMNTDPFHDKLYCRCVR